jgi:hypothetical protein
MAVAITARLWVTSVRDGDWHEVMMAPSRWMGVGNAARGEPEPGARAAERAIPHAGVDLSDAKLLIVFCSVAHDLEAILRQIRTRSGPVPLIGCTTAGEISTDGAEDGAVIVAALGGEGFSVATAAATGASRDLRAAGGIAARCASSVESRPYQVMLLLTDGLAGNQQEIIRGAYHVLGAGVPLVGGLAADELEMTRTFQLHGDEVLTDAVVGAFIASDGPLGVGVRHGWRRTGEPMLVTRSRGNNVYTLNGEPALDVYLDRIGLGGRPAPFDQAGVPLTTLEHPLGLARRIGEDHARFVMGGDQERRSLTCAAEVPQGGLVWIMEGDLDSVLAATNAACQDSIAALDGRPPLGLLAFDCVTRRMMLGDDGLPAELSRMSESAGGSPIAGFYTYGEIARTHGVSGFHNETLAVLAVG